MEWVFIGIFIFEFVLRLSLMRTAGWEDSDEEEEESPPTPMPFDVPAAGCSGARGLEGSGQAPPTSRKRYGPHTPLVYRLQNENAQSNDLCATKSRSKATAAQRLDLVPLAGRLRQGASRWSQSRLPHAQCR